MTNTVNEPSKRELLELQNAVKLLKSENSRLTAAAEENQKILDKLYAKENLFHSVLNGMLDSIAVLDWDGTVLFVNNSAATILGHNSPEDVIGKNQISFLHPDYVERAAGDMQLVLEGNADFLAEYQLLINGKTIDVESRGTVVNFNGKPADLVSFRDVTKRNQKEAEAKALQSETEHKLQQLNEKLEEMVNERTIEFETEKAFNDTALSAVPGLFYVLDKKGKFARWNQQMQTITGFSKEEMAGMTATTFFKDEELNRVTESIKETLETGASSVEAALFTKDGKRIPHLFTGKRQQIGDDVYILGMGIDISDRKKTEQLLQDSEAKFKAMTETTSAIITMGAETDVGYRLTYANQAALDCFEYSWDELKEMDPLAFFFGDSQRQIDEFEEVILNAKNGDEIPPQMEVEITTKSGKNRWIECTGKLIELDGQTIELSTAFDITDRKVAQKSLLESEDRYKAIFETTGTGTIIFDDNALIDLANQEWCEMVGYSRKELEGKMPWSDFFTQESLEKMRRYHKTRISDPLAVPRSYEADMVDRQGRIHNGIVTISVIPGTTQRVGSFLDLTELKKAEQQMFRADKMAALGQIIAGVAHEINNPNNFIFFNLPILKRYIEAIRPLLDHYLEQDPDLKILNMPYQAFLEDTFKLLENMEHGSKRITGIVSELKNYVRDEGSTDFTAVQISDVIDRALSLVGKQVRKMVKNFQVIVAEDLPSVCINPGKIEQVFINLLINAGQAANKENSRITIDVNVADDSYIEIIVTDNGKGIPKESLHQIFEPFFTSKGRDAGTGLGLSISHKIIEDHGGTISVQSKENEGTTFLVRLPSCNAPAA